MACNGLHTADEIEAAGTDLLGWAQRHGGVLSIAAMMGEDDELSGVGRPEALVAGDLGAVNEGELAVLIAQLEVAVLLVLSQMASNAEMGEGAFRRMVVTARRAMLDAGGLDLCDKCGG